MGTEQEVILISQKVIKGSQPLSIESWDRRTDVVYEQTNTSAQQKKVHCDKSFNPVTSRHVLLNVLLNYFILIIFLDI